MKLSVITPSHDTRWLSEVYRSLTMQTYKNWEWIVVLNGEALNKPPFKVDDKRVKVKRSVKGGIGNLKATAARFAKGAVIVELDHDDWLMPEALEAVAKVYEQDQDVAMIWSDFAHMDENGEPSSFSYNNEIWKYTSEFAYNKRWHRVCGMEQTPQTISRIWFAPNHLRAWPVRQYWAAGGHQDREILDDQDLMQRLYKIGPFVHIPEMLYLQRWHPLNSQSDIDTNALIQVLTVQMGDEWLATL